MTISEPPELFAGTRCVVGEGAVWCQAEQCFYWVDLASGHVYRQKPEAGVGGFEVFRFDLGKIGGIVCCKSGKFLLFCQGGVVCQWSAGSDPKPVARLAEAADGRFNDVMPSLDGSVFCTVAPTPAKKGQLWRLSPDLRFELVEGGLGGMPNGMGFSPSGKTFYFTVSDERAIYKYSYAGGAIAGKSLFVKVPDSEGLPDGMSVDSAGNVWSAQWNGGRVAIYSPNGEKIGEIKFPIAKITSLAFGGSGLGKIIITTANSPWNEGDFAAHGAGKTFSMPAPLPGLEKPLADF